MTIGAILARKGGDVVSIDGNSSVAEAIALLAEKRIGAVPVVDNGGVAGVFSERDVIYCLRSDGAEMLGWPVVQVMTAPAITVTRDVSVLAAMSQMTQRRIRHLPVVEDGRLIGIVSIGDLVKFRIDRIEEEAEALRTYITQV
ncbi:CBS domain-containing protein [Sphingomonas sp.]|uniref:CBS domain-containing protein n=1 Tax=Sphingomonas sp. TaxID=28214 RepID=UPI002FC66F86